MDGIEGAVLDAGAADVSQASDTGGEVVEQVEAGGEPAAAATEGQESTVDQTETDGDGRTLPKDVQAALKALRELNPANGKTVETLRKSYFANQQYAKVFPSPSVAQQAKATLELIGGEQGISGLQERVASAEQIDAGLETGDPVILDDVFKNFGDGIAKLTPHILDRLQQVNPQAYAKTLQPHTYAAMEAAGLGGALSEITRLLGANDVNGAKDWLSRTQNWLNGQKEAAGTAKTSQADPERQKFEAERTKFAEEKEQNFRSSLGSQTLSHQTEVISKAIAPYLKSKPLGNDAKSDLQDGINREINRRLKADVSYQGQMKAMLSAKTRDASKIVAYVNAKLDQEAPEAAKAVWARRYGSAAPKAAPSNGQPINGRPPVPTGIGSSPQQPVKVAQKPDINDRDFDKDPKQMHMLASRAFMKSGPHKGKWVSWAP